LGSEQIVDQALQDGEIDFYPEYAGTALVGILGSEIGDLPEMSEATYVEARSRYAERNAAGTMLAPANFNNNYGIFVWREVAEELGLETLQGLSEASPQLTFATFSELQDRADGFPNMLENYPVLDFGDIVTVNDLGLRYQGVQEGETDAGVGFLTDGQLTSDELVVMEDEKSIWPFYYPAPVVRSNVLEENSEIEDILNSVTETLGVEAMRELNGKVDIEQEDPEDVAREFLQEQSLI